jgi:hypothetical protein
VVAHLDVDVADPALLADHRSYDVDALGGEAVAEFGPRVHQLVASPLWASEAWA